ncbi:hypothetical protein [Actinomadura roseirufa]|uniref:hypothetical protein n=1 Tax=Actinomadura roseirufa TaxID=2094049 RepID=UPI0010414E43|nr:hypothetical protein [Actinomadura roseirufa]
MAAWLGLEGVVHLLTVSEESAVAHTKQLESVFALLGRRLARLSAGDSAEVRAAAYEADVVVGTVDDFVADLGRETELGIVRHAAVIEGDPTGALVQLLDMYRRVMPG